MDDNGISEQRVQAIWCDIYVPHDVPAGWYRGTVTVHADGIAPISLNLRVRVYDVTLPDELNFNPELNCYYSGSGWFKPGSEKWFAAHKLAHAHRCTINRVPYSQSGHVDASVAPKVVGDGVNQRVADWSEFDNCVGPLLNGSAFATNPRKGVPVKVMYLPFHENYPNPIAKHYRYRGEQYGQRCIILHALFAPPIERAFTREYMDGFRSIVRDFAEHFARMGWTRTIFQCYLNNKYRYRIMGRGTSWWLLDEPAGYDDWMALRFFSRMFHEALVGQSTGLMRKHTTLLYKGVQFAFRGDISRPEWQFERMDGLMEMMYVNNSIFTKVRRCRIMKERMPTILCVYGSCNRVGENNFQTVAWCLKAFIAGADGVLPWQSLAGDSAFFNADQCGLLVDGERFGEHVIASFRVKALRRGAELVELL
ncbi:MAG TPA: hypothetical protein EYP10_01170, partial [Armatimonadetes bacterium]|nr:hypothetical protein [Armatimonadota bacterium]